MMDCKGMNRATPRGKALRRRAVRAARIQACRVRPTVFPSSAFVDALRWAGFVLSDRGIALARFRLPPWCGARFRPLTPKALP